MGQERGGHGLPQVLAPILEETTGPGSRLNEGALRISKPLTASSKSPSGRRQISATG